jgi:ParB-like chromosome segregation protein Spo0J
VEISFVEIEDLSGYEKNARKHSDEQVTQLAASIQEFGFTNPILIDENKMVIAGHGRLAAALELGLDSVPSITLDGLSEDQKRAYVIADNKLALKATWDWDLLAQELQAIDESDMDFELTGFSEEEFDELVQSDDLIDLNPENAEESLSGANLLRLTFGKNRVELSQGEFDSLEAKLQTYIENYGGSYGFIEVLLNA